MIKKRHTQVNVVLLLILLVGVFFLDTSQVFAAKDSKKPSVSLKADNTNPTNGKITITIKAKDASGISAVKWASGSKDTAYFKKSGKKLKLNSKNTATVSITKNGKYSFYVIDKAGNVRIKKITITNIDNTYPTIAIKKSTTKPTNKSVKLTITLGDEGLGIKSVKYLTGKKYDADFSNAGKELTIKQTKVEEGSYSSTYVYTAKFTVKSNNTYTFLVEDMAGNRSLRRTKIKNIDKEDPVLNISLSTNEPTKEPVTIQVTATDEGLGVKEVQYLPGKKDIDNFETEEPKNVVLNNSAQGLITVTKNGNYTILVTDIAGNQVIQTIKVSNIDTYSPIMSLDYSVKNQVATIIIDAFDDESGIKSFRYLKGEVTDINSDKWDDKGTEVIGSNSFNVTSAGNYSVLATDLAGNKTAKVIYVELELRAVWISYLEFLAYGNIGYSEENFHKFIDYMFDNVVSMNMNAVIVHVRPFGDAMYDSKYFPWSKYAAGKQGLDPGFDPMEYMIEAAHERGLEFHAWLNPYRVTTASTDYSLLSKDNPARVWYEDDDEENDRNVLSFGGNLYYNPASKEVQTLITNGIKEIITNYDVDGIHFDDYFYPSLGSNYAKVFDNVEYITYVSESKEDNKTPLSIADWRRNNVNTLIKNIYKTIKKVDTNIEFGISPGGFIDSLTSNLGYYVDYKTWLSKDGYIDYICPQIYWSFSHSSYPYDKTLDKWLAARTNMNVKMYVGIATYKSGSSLEQEWKNDPNVLKKQVEYGRDTGLVDGFMFFRYDFFYNKVTKPGVERLLKLLED